MKRTRLSAAELARLDSCLRPAGWTAVELSGFFAALATSPDLVPPSAWLPGVLPQPESLVQAEEALGLIMRHYNDVVRALARDTLVIPAEREARQSWCAGYMRAARRDDVFLCEEGDDDSSLSLFYIMLAARELDDEELENDAGEPLDTAEQIAIALESVPDLVRDLYELWRDERAAVEPPPKTRAPGRNDPCPCGSGKKFKRCCLH